MAGFVTNRDPLAGNKLPDPAKPEDEDEVLAAGDPRDIPELMAGELAGFGVLPEAEERDLVPFEDEEDDRDLPVPPTDDEVTDLITRSEPVAVQYFKERVQSKIAAAQRAVRNEHPAGSKYASDAYKNRSRYFRPKSRQALRKTLTATANALFATSDVVKVEPGDESNVQHKANAAIQQELLKYRLDRKSPRNAIPYFKIALGARADAYVTGWSIAKVTWDLRQIYAGREDITASDGQPIVDATGKPIQRKRFNILRDRPDVKLYPVELCGIAPTADWANPGQDSAYAFLINPMHLNDVRVLMTKNEKSNIPWRDFDTIPQGAWTGARGGAESEARETREARSGGADRFEQNFGAQKQGKDDNPLVWVKEWFFDWDGTDYCVWVCGGELLSDPIPTAEAYPEQRGMRPIVLGTDTIEPHELYPISNVAALQPVQQEINDHVNLRLDAGRQAIFPLAKVRRGKNIDAAQVHRRGPNTTILVEDPDDVTFEVPPANVANAMAEMDRLNMDFDEAAGQFSSSSVQSNRSLNETVGGMQILAGDAQATSNMDLRVWTETFLEPLLTMIVNLEMYYESDTTVLALCATKADVFQKFGISQVNDDLLMSEVMTTVNIGVGAADPSAAMGRFQAAWNTAMPAIQGEINEKRVKPNVKAIVDEVFGQAQFKDAGARFFTFAEEGQQDPAAQLQQLQQQVAQLTEENTKLKAGADVKLAVANIEAGVDIQKAHIQAETDVKKAVVTTQIQAQMGVQKEQLADQRAEKDFERTRAMEGEKFQRTKELKGIEHEQKLSAADRSARNALVGKVAPAMMMPEPPAGAAPGGMGGGDDVGQALEMMAQALQQQTAIMSMLAEKLAGPGVPQQPAAPQPAPPPPGPEAMPPEMGAPA